MPASTATAPFGGSGALKVWRSFLTDEYAKQFAKSGGLGIASHVYDTLLHQQGQMFRRAGRTSEIEQPLKRSRPSSRWRG